MFYLIYFLVYNLLDIAILQIHQIKNLNAAGNQWKQIYHFIEY